MHVVTVDESVGDDSIPLFAVYDPVGDQGHAFEQFVVLQSGRREYGRDENQYEGHVRAGIFSVTTL